MRTHVRLLEAAQTEPERVAAHLLLASPASDTGAVASLRKAARRARSRDSCKSTESACHTPGLPGRREVDLLVRMRHGFATVGGLAAGPCLLTPHPFEARSSGPYTSAGSNFGRGVRVLSIARNPQAFNV